MTRGHGVIAIAGFNYQHAYAAWRVVKLLGERQLVSVTFEGDEDLDLRYREQNYVVNECVQIKTREEGQPRWSLSEIGREVIGPMICRALHEDRIARIHFVTTGEPDAKVHTFKERTLPALAARCSTVSDEDHALIGELERAVTEYLRARGATQVSSEMFRRFLAKLQITTRHNDFATLHQLTHALVHQLGVKDGRELERCRTLFAEVARRSGLRTVALRTLDERQAAALLGLPAPSSARNDDLHQFKDPAESWYVERPEERRLATFLEDAKNGTCLNLLITGESGIGKSSILNRTRILANDLGLFTVKMRVFDLAFNDFLRQLVDEILDQLKPLGIQDIHDRRDHPKMRLLAVLSAFRRIQHTASIVLMIDQFERLFEESRVRIDESLMRDVWRRFQEIAAEVNALGRISFVITARQHFFWLMFPSDEALHQSRFSYITLLPFRQDEADALLVRLLDISGRSLTPKARDLFLDKTDREPQVITLAFVNAFAERPTNEPMDFPELLQCEPWNEVFKRDIDLVCRDELERLAVFAMANIERELCDVAEIRERVMLVQQCTEREVGDALFRVQNTRRLIKQPKEGKYSFYHRRVGEFIMRHYKSQFPDQWGEAGVIWDVHKMLSDEVRRHEKFNTLLGSDHFQIVNNHRERLELDSDELALVVKSSIVNDTNVKYWEERAGDLCMGLTPFFRGLLHHSVSAVRSNAIRLLGHFGCKEDYDEVARLVDLPLDAPNPATLEEAVKPHVELLKQVIETLEKVRYFENQTEHSDQLLLAAILFSSNARFWFGSDVNKGLSVMSLLKRYLDKKGVELVNENNFLNLVWAVELSKSDDFCNTIFEYTKDTSESAYHRNQDTRRKSLRILFDGHIATKPSFYVKLAESNCRTKNVESLRCISAVFARIKSSLLPIPRNEVVTTFEELTGSLGEATTEEGWNDVIRDCVKIFENENPEAQASAIKILGKRLRHAADAKSLIDALKIYSDIDDLTSVKDILTEIRDRTQLRASDGDRNTLAVGLKGLLETVQHEEAAEIVEDISINLIKETAFSNAFRHPNHQAILNLHDATLDVTLVREKGLSRHIDTLKELPCNQLLRIDLISCSVIAWAKSSEPLPLSVAMAAAENYEDVVGRLHDELDPEELEFKGDVFLRQGRVTELFSSERASAAKERARIAYRQANAYHNSMEYRDSYENAIRCITKSVMVGAEFRSEAEMVSVLESIVYYQLDDIAEALWEAGLSDLASKALEICLRNCDDGSFASEIGIAFFKKSLERGHQEMALVSLKACRYADEFYENIESNCRLIVSMLNHPESGSNSTPLFEELLNDGSWWIAEYLTEALIKGEHTSLARHTMGRFFEQCDDAESAYNSALNWAEVVSRWSDESLIRHCVAAIRGADVFYDEPDPHGRLLVKLLSAQDSESAPSPLLCEFIQSDDLILVENLADALIQEGRETVARIAMLRFLKQCDDEESSLRASVRWFDVAIRWRDASLARVCWHAIDLTAKSLYVDIDDLVAKTVRHLADDSLGAFGEKLCKMVISSNDVAFLDCISKSLIKAGRVKLANRVERRAKKLK